MGIVYRQQKGDPLTIEEMDGNFKDLDTRLKELETKPIMAEGVLKITQEGDEITFMGTLGTELGHARLPKTFPNPRGKWQPETIYNRLDWAQMGNGVYACIKSHRSAEFKGDIGNWALVFEV